MVIGLAFAPPHSCTALAAEPARTLQIFVSKDQQSLVVYDGAKVVATSKVSTGKAGHTTPTGIFSMLEKRSFHKSNIYSDAPMPFMQRLTWSGIALHESNPVPRYPASHGCVRMPGDFAKKLFRMTDRGVHVLITDRSAGAGCRSPIPFCSNRRPPRPALLSDVTLRPDSLAGPDEAGGSRDDRTVIQPKRAVVETERAAASRSAC